MRLYIEIFVQEEALSSMRTRTRTRHVRLLVCWSVSHANYRNFKIRNFSNIKVLPTQ